MTDTIPVRPSTTEHGRRSALLLTVGFVLLSANARIAFGQTGPLAPAIGLEPWLVTLLGVIPPLGMGVFAPLGAMLRHRIGQERALVAASAVLLLGTALRGIGIPALVIGTVIVSAAIAVINVLVPVLVRSRFAPGRVGAMMGVYALSMGLGSAVTAALVVPVLDGTGSWTLALGVAVIPASLALVSMLPQARQRLVGSMTPAESPRPRHIHPGRTALGWSLAAFFGLQTLLFYATLAWLPSILTSAGLSSVDAGAQQALVIVGTGVGGLVVPIIAAASRRQTVHVLGVIAVCAMGFAGLLLAPDHATWVWSLVIGAGLGGAQALAPMLFVKRASDHDHVAALAGFAQMIGYVIAACGPPLASAVHAATGGWQAVLIGSILVLAVNAVVSTRAGRD